MLTTPKFLVETLSSPPTSTPVSAPTPVSVPCDEMLTTPIITTPRSEIWAKTNNSSASVLNLTTGEERKSEKEDENASSTNELLPLDSDIGLRSPCDGLLAKRRKYKLKLGSSLNSDSNSNDTNNSAQNSPRDLSLSNNKNKSNSSNEINDNNRRQSRSLSKNLPSHYTPSPLAVPSPNWSAVERYFGGQDMNKTPKLLDNNVFDFLGPPPITPRTKPSSRENRSPNGLEYQRLSPRFPIPETPTDLSNKGDECEQEPQDAQDLSIKSNLLIVKTELVEDNNNTNATCTNHLNNHFDLLHKATKMEPRSVSPSPYLYADRFLSNASAIRSQSASPPSKFRHNNSLESGENDSEPWNKLHSNGFGIEHQQQFCLNSKSSSSLYTVTALDTDLILVPLPKSVSTASATTNGGTFATTERVAATSTSAATPKRRRAPKGSRKKSSRPEESSSASKRVYACPHCQRTYDWNYNLNRHLKYECGKENAFQCSKCGRKFPHKQNCVYHLKRKHKIVCESIEEYMRSGLVLFRGAVDLDNSASGKNNEKKKNKNKENK